MPFPVVLDVGFPGVYVLTVMNSCYRHSRVVSTALLMVLASWWHAPGATARTVTDLLGRRVEVPDRVERLVALGPGTLRLVVYLGAADRIVATEAMESRMDTDLRPYAAALGDRLDGLPVVAQGGPGVHSDPERLIAVRPDLVLVTTMDIRGIAVLAQRTRLPVVALSYGELGVYRKEALQSLTLLGELLDRRERAREILDEIDALEKDLRSRVAHVRRPPTAYIGGMGFKGGHGIESTEAGYPPFGLVRADNIVRANGDGGGRHMSIDREYLLARDPDHLFIDLNGFRLVEADVRKRPGFYRALGAVQAGRVHALLPYNYYNTNIETVYANAYAVGKTLYPDRFGDIDPAAKARAIVTFFVGVDAYARAAARGLRYGRVELSDERLAIH